MGGDIRLNPLSLAGVACVVILGGALFSMFSLIVACLVKTRERFMGIGQVLMVHQGQSAAGIPLDITVLLGSLTLLIGIAAWLFPGIVR